ncbi:MAG: ATP-binding protein [Candidatus Lokiarchaeota archaeon]|jgi:uncharacterized protein (TIGR00269 family)
MIPILSSKNSKCSLCGKNADLYRKHSGQYMCNYCFIKSVEKIINKTISKYKMLNPYDKIIVAVSGGKDSIALLYNLIQIQQQVHSSKNLVALTVDEGIKGYRNESFSIAEDFCKKFNIEHHIIYFKEEFGLSLDEIVNKENLDDNYMYACNYCATIRRRLLNDHAKELGGSKLALGHNLTDFAETFLMNILYKRMGLIGNQYPLRQEPTFLQKFFIRKIFPLMRIPEDEIELYMQLKKINYYPKHCPYREKDPILRKRVLQFIDDTKKMSPEIEFNLLNGFLELSELLYKNRGKIDYNLCYICGYPSGNNEKCRFCALKTKLRIE